MGIYATPTPRQLGPENIARSSDTPSNSRTALQRGHWNFAVHITPEARARVDQRILPAHPLPNIVNTRRRRKPYLWYGRFSKLNGRHQKQPVSTGEDKQKHPENHQVRLNSSDATHTGNSLCNTLQCNVRQAACKYMERGNIGFALMSCRSRTLHGGDFLFHCATRGNHCVT